MQEGGKIIAVDEIIGSKGGKIGWRVSTQQTSRHGLMGQQTSRHELMGQKTSRHGLLGQMTSRHGLVGQQTSRHGLVDKFAGHPGRWAGKPVQAG